MCFYFATMNCVYVLFMLISLPAVIYSFTLNIDGSIDLGPVDVKHNLQRAYQRAHSTRGIKKKQKIIRLSAKRQDYVEESLRSRKKQSTTPRIERSNRAKQKKSRTKRVTEILRLHHHPYAVRDDKRIQDFSLHIYKQTLKVFDGLKDKTYDSSVKVKIDAAAKSYKEKFAQFWNETKNYDIRTRSGAQKAILNIVDMSNIIMQRLVNYLVGDLDKHDLLRVNMPIARGFQKDIDQEKETEYRHICAKFGICRSSNSFSSFLHDTLVLLLDNPNDKMKLALNSLTEVLKYTKFRSIMDKNTEQKFQKGIDNFDRADEATSRLFLILIKNILLNKNKPLSTVPGVAASVVNRTIAFRECIDLLDKQITPTEENVLEWNDLKNSIKEWTAGERSDLQDIAKSLVNHVKSKGLDKLDRSSQSTFMRNMKLLVTYSPSVVLV